MSNELRFSLVFEILKELKYHSLLTVYDLIGPIQLSVKAVCRVRSNVCAQVVIVILPFVLQDSI